MTSGKGRSRNLIHFEISLIHLKRSWLKTEQKTLEKMRKACNHGNEVFSA